MLKQFQVSEHFVILLDYLLKFSNFIFNLIQIHVDHKKKKKELKSYL